MEVLSLCILFPWSTRVLKCFSVSISYFKYSVLSIWFTKISTFPFDTNSSIYSINQAYFYFSSFKIIVSYLISSFACLQSPISIITFSSPSKSSHKNFIFLFIVAVNNIIYLSLLIAYTIFRTWNSNPIVIIWSASSITKYVTLFKFVALCLTRSISLPGVAIITSTPWRSDFH